MACVTICVPAFNSGQRIFETLKSVQDQSYRNFKVRVAIEPTGPEAFDDAVRSAFKNDERFEFFDNDSVLGWARNIDILITHVDTEFFAILPHDDFWDQDYLAKLLPIVDANSEASVAYADMQVFGASEWVKTVRLDNTDISTRLLTFYLEGAEAVPWRGVTRKSMLSRSGNFPQHKYMSFAVECEYAQRLICSGKAIRTSEPLYYKRTYGLGAQSVSTRWVTELGHDEKRAALELHRARMLSGIPVKIRGKISRKAIVLACEISMLRRTSHLGQGQFGLSSAQRQRIDEIKVGLAKIEPCLRPILTECLNDTLSALLEVG